MPRVSNSAPMEGDPFSERLSNRDYGRRSTPKKPDYRDYGGRSVPREAQVHSRCSPPPPNQAVANLARRTHLPSVPPHTYLHMFQQYLDTPTYTHIPAVPPTLSKTRTSPLYICCRLYIGSPSAVHQLCLSSTSVLSSALHPGTKSALRCLPISCTSAVQYLSIGSTTYKASRPGNVGYVLES